jgi:alpha-beta hydrolase superfamily lysophospholipase
VNIPFEDVYLETENGVKLHGWFVPANNAKYTILFCHGNGGCLAHRVETIELFHNLGVNVFIFDYRGYGKSRGHITEKGLFNDADSAWNYLTNVKKLKREDIIVVGRSLGGALAAYLAEKYTPAGLILESAFISIPEAGHDFYPWLPVRTLCKYKFPTAEFLKKAKCPVLVIASPDDEIVKFRHGKQLAATAPALKEFVELSGTHDECYFECREKYTAALRNFMKSLAPEK